MGKSASNQPTSSTVTQTTLPAYAQPYVERVMSGAEAIANRPYETYSGPRIAPFGQDQQQAFNLARDAPGMGTTQFNAGDANTNAGAAGIAAAGYNPTAQSGSYNPTAYNPNTFSNQTANAAQVGTGTWDTNAAQQYMSPYLSQVLDQLTARQNQNYGMARLGREADAKKAGVFGGYNQGVQEAVARGQHEMNLGDLIAQNLNTGYNNAYGMFNSDQGRALTAAQSNQSTGLQAILANQQSDLERQRMDEASRQYGSTFNDSQQRAATDYGFQDEANRFRGAQQQLAVGQGLAGIGAQQYGQGAQRQTSYLQGLDALRSTGLDQQRQTQASLDQAYNDFVNQRDYERNNMTWLNNIIRGNTTSANSNTTQTESYNPYTQMLGLGVGAVGLANALNGNNSGSPG